MERTEDVIELGTASVETQGGDEGLPEIVGREFAAGLSSEL